MDLAARNELVERNLRLAHRFARSEAGRTGKPVDELLSCAFLGLIRAAERYDERRDIKFSTLAAPCILGAIREEARAAAWVSRDAHAHGVGIRKAGEALTGQLRRPPTDGELARELGWTEEKLINRRSEADRGEIGLLEDPDVRAGDESDPALVYEMREGRRELIRAVRALPERQRAAIVGYFWGGLTWRQVAARLRCSESGAYKTHVRAIEKLRSTLGAEWAWR